MNFLFQAELGSSNYPTVSQEAKRSPLCVIKYILFQHMPFLSERLQYLHPFARGTELQLKMS